MLKIRIFQSFFYVLFIWQSILFLSTDPVFCASAAPTRAPAVACTGTAFPTLSSWIAACRTQPLNRQGADFTKGHSGFVSLGSKKQQWHEFSVVLNLWFNMMLQGPMQQDSSWQLSNTNIKKPAETPFFDTDVSDFFIPFAQKLVVQPQAKFYIRGDLHGDIFSLLLQLYIMQRDRVIDDSFRILADDVWILFLGDYVDRGQYGCEVLYTMMRLALANPDRVFFVRGNHEDVAMNKGFEGWFADEVNSKFHDDLGVIHETIARMNDFLPVVLYVGCQDPSTQVTSYVQCCHGGIEIGYDPKPFLDNHSTTYQLLGLLHRKKFVEEFNKKFALKDGWMSWGLSFVKKPKVKTMQSWWQTIKDKLEDDVDLKTPNDAFKLGFMWYDFDVDNTAQVYYKDGRGMYYGKTATEQILETQSSAHSKICGIFRAHQHGDPAMMKGLVLNGGVYKLWALNELQIAPQSRRCDDGLVWTFNVGPDSWFGVHDKFNFDAYAKFTIDRTMQQWSLMVFNTNVVPVPSSPKLAAPKPVMPKQVTPKQLAP